MRSLYKLLYLVLCLDVIIINSLAQEVADPKKAFVRAAFVGSKELVQYFIDQNADLEAQCGVYDRQVFANGNLPSPIGSENWTPLLAIASSSVIPDTQISIARSLLDKGARIDAQDRYGVTALHAAIMRNNVELALFLIRRKAPLNGRIQTILDNIAGETPLHLAVGHPFVVEALLKAGADPAAKREDGQTPLDCAEGFSESKSIISEHLANRSPTRKR